MAERITNEQMKQYIEQGFFSYLQEKHNFPPLQIRSSRRENGTFSYNIISPNDSRLLINLHVIPNAVQGGIKIDADYNIGKAQYTQRFENSHKNFYKNPKTEDLKILGAGYTFPIVNLSTLQPQKPVVSNGKETQAPWYRRILKFLMEPMVPMDGASILLVGALAFSGSPKTVQTSQAGVKMPSSPTVTVAANSAAIQPSRQATNS